MMKFNEKYNHGNFLDFLNNFLPEDFLEKEEDIVINKERYKEIAKAKILGFSESLDLYVLEMDHIHEKDPRVAIATDAFKILADHWMHRALVIFKNRDSENYRLSLLTISLDLNEKNKAFKRYSNPRRNSFYLGPNAKTRTPEKYLIKDGGIADFEDLLERFSVEVVNKDFYKDIARFFNRLVGGDVKLTSKAEHFDPEMHLPSVDKSNHKVYQEFTVRLIGRIIFCWFLKQKKSQNNISLLPDEFLSVKSVENNPDYYHGILEKIFFEVLNKPIDQRNSELTKGFSKIPYLNGGLFDPQGDDFYEGQANYALKIPDQWFKELFEILETYNFTIDENTVLDMDLSIDPEMLGRIFENLLAEINPETGQSARKATGSFYTPRPIVEYLVDQSLIQYLLNKTGIEEEKIKALVSIDDGDDSLYPLNADEKLKVVEALNELKIIDPACGSGAFPIGILQKIVFMLGKVDQNGQLWFEKKTENLDPLIKGDYKKKFENENFNYIRKTGVIRDSIYGIDIQPIAVEVSKLRSFLTLIVDEDIDDNAENRGIKPLPNLEFKFVATNSLISLPGSLFNGGQTGMFEEENEIEKLKKLRDQYFVSNGLEKERIKNKFKDVQRAMFKNQITKKGYGEMTMALADWEPFSNISSSWFDPEWMFGIENGFDIVIGNPPYLRIQGLQKTQSEMIPLYRKNYESAQGSFDLYALFIERGLTLLSNKGELAYIVPHKFFQASFGKNLRNIITSKKALSQIVKFGAEQVFDDPSTYTCLLFLSTQPKEEFKYIDVTSTKDLTQTMSAISDNRKTASAVESSLPAPSGDEWSFQVGKSGEVLRTLNKQPQKLDDVVEKIFQGIATSADKIYVLKILEEKDKTMSLFSNSLQEEVEIEKGFLRPFLMGKDVHRYENLTPKNYVIFPYIISKGKVELMSSIYIQDNYPNGWEYILKHQKTLEEREGGKFKKEWWCFSRPQNMAMYDSHKIMTPEIALGSQMSFDDKGVAHTTKVYSFIFKTNLQEDLKYWLGLLNSKILWFFLSNTGYVLRGGYFTFKTNYLTPFPIKRIDFKNKAEKEAHDEIVTLVNTILNGKKSDSKANTKDLESQIDNLVYKLYDLTGDEIKIIESSL